MNERNYEHNNELDNESNNENNACYIFDVINDEMKSDE